jgi:hypothetical protein
MKKPIPYACCEWRYHLLVLALNGGYIREDHKRLKGVYKHRPTHSLGGVPVDDLREFAEATGFHPLLKKVEGEPTIWSLFHDADLMRALREGWEFAQWWDQKNQCTTYVTPSRRKEKV